MVSYTLYANGGASYRGYAIVLHDSVNPVIISQANGSVNISVSVSGSNIQVTQISGGTMTIYWNATRFSMT